MRPCMRADEVTAFEAAIGVSGVLSADHEFTHPNNNGFDSGVAARCSIQLSSDSRERKED